MSKRAPVESTATRPAAPAKAVKPGIAPAATHLQRAVARPSLASLHDAVQMQQRYGNRAVQRWLSGGSVQAKLTVSPADDRSEREAGRVAEQVMEHQGQAPEGVQRQPLAGAISRLAQPAANENDALLRQALDDDTLKRAPEAGSRVGRAGGPVADTTRAGIDQARGGGQPLPDRVRQPMETAFGADFSSVKVHTDSRANALNESLSARAFTTGRDVFFRQGEFSPASRVGQKLLAHELTHVVQQGGVGQTVRRALAEETETAVPATTPAAETEQSDLRDALTARRVDRLRPGDVLLRRGGEELASDLAQYGRYLQQLWRGQARGAGRGLPQAGLFLGGGLLAQAKGNGVARVPVQGAYYVFRCANRGLAEMAARLAEDWSVFANSVSSVEGKYSLLKNFEALALSSRYNRSRAVNLAALFLRGASVNQLLCPDFAIRCYQAAALEEEVALLKGASPPPVPTAPDNATGQPKRGLAALPSGALRLDPRRIRPFQFAAELHRLASGDNPGWELAGLY